MTHTQANLIIALLAIVAFCVGTFLAQDWYYSFRAWRQQRAAKRERLDREYQAQLDWERKQRECPHPKPKCSICGRGAHVEVNGQPRCDEHSTLPPNERTA